MSAKIQTELMLAVPDVAGQLSHILARLAKAGVNVLGICGYAIGAGTSQIHLVPDNAEKARKVLEKEGYEIETAQVVTMTGPSGRGEVAKLLHRLEGLNLQYTWATTSGTGTSLVVLKPADPEAAVKALT